MSEIYERVIEDDGLTEETYRRLRSALHRCKSDHPFGMGPENVPQVMLVSDDGLGIVAMWESDFRAIWERMGEE